MIEANFNEVKVTYKDTVYKFERIVVGNTYLMTLWNKENSKHPEKMVLISEKEFKALMNTLKVDLDDIYNFLMNKYKKFIDKSED